MGWHGEVKLEAFLPMLPFMLQGNYFVYIITNPGKTVLYTGLTNDLATRLQQHYASRGKRETFAGRAA
jgi:putative endonuclease